MITAELVAQHEPWLLPHLPDADGRTMLDIGAHVGPWTVDLVDHFQHIHCFEPNPPVAEALEFNVRQWVAEGRVFVHKIALGATSGELLLHLFAGSMQASAYTDEELETMPRGAVRHSLYVPQRTLDEMELTEVDYIKIDTEGAELDVVMGGWRTIRRDRPQLLIECHTLANRNALVKQLNRLYAISHIPHPHEGVPPGHSWLAARRKNK